MCEQVNIDVEGGSRTVKIPGGLRYQIVNFILVNCLAFSFNLW